MDAGWFGDDDVSGAVTFLTARPDVYASRIGAVGLWMGGEEAVDRLLDGEPRHGVTAQAAMSCSR